MCGASSPRCFGALCAAPEPFEKTSDDRLILVYAFLESTLLSLFVLERAVMGYFKCTLFSESAALNDGNMTTT